MQTNDLKRKTKNKKSKDVGRGGKRGKTSGRGHKGQGQHGGHGLRPQMRDIIKKFPKLRGHGKNRARTVNSGVEKPVGVNLAVIESNFNSGESVSPKEFVKTGIIKQISGKTPKIKILGNGEISKSVKVFDCEVSESAKEKIVKAGGSVK
jgi:large subunit ribosomal protein L15